MANNILHKIKAYLYDNVLTKDDLDDFIARVISERTLNTKEICQSATTRGGADVSAEAMEHSVNLFLKEMGYQLCDGYSVNTGWFTAGVQIKNTFRKGEKFDPKKHNLLFTFNQGTLLRKELQNIEVEILGVADPTLSVLEVTDVKTGSVNDLLTPNRNLKINGYKLKISGDNPDVGIYFVNQDTQVRVKVDGSDVAVNNPSELIVIIPELAAGSYKLEITTQFSVGHMLKVPRTTIFERELTVE